MQQGRKYLSTKQIREEALSRYMCCLAYHSSEAGIFLQELENAICKLWIV